MKTQYVNKTGQASLINSIRKCQKFSIIRPLGNYCALLCLINMAAAGTILPPQSLSAVFFARNLFSALNQANEVKGNFIVSPAAARSAMTLIFMAAAGKSADELRFGLVLGPAKKLDIAKEHAKSFADDCVCNKKGVALRVVTRLYVKNDQELRDDFNITAEEFFNAYVDTLNFTDSEKTLRQANRWLELQTFDTVRNLLSPTYFSPESSVILANSLYFRAKWAIPFREKYTLMDDFWINEKQRMHVNMMRQVRLGCVTLNKNCI